MGDGMHDYSRSPQPSQEWYRTDRIARHKTPNAHTGAGRRDTVVFVKAVVLDPLVVWLLGMPLHNSIRPFHERLRCDTGIFIGGSLPSAMKSTVVERRML